MTGPSSAAPGPSRASTRSGGTERNRFPAAARLAWGITLLSAPGAVLRRAGGAQVDTPAAKRVARVLGGRHVLQAATELAIGRTSWLGVAVDASHALSMLALAAASPRWRRPALVSATAAGSFAVTGCRRR